MGLTIETGVSALTVFLQGIFSFFSPCVLPLVPLYIGYLSGGTITGENQESYKRSRVFGNTLCFVTGVSFAFFALGLGFTAAGRFFSGYQVLFARIGGILVILFGLYQLGVFGSSRLLGRELRLPVKLEKLGMNPFTALILGFAFSFAWTPCVGPALASVLLMAASAKSAGHGFVLIAIYTLGFVLPFLIVGFFAGEMLRLLRKHRNVVKYTVKAGGVLMILMGVMMLTGWMNNITGYLNSISPGGTGNTPVQERESEPVKGKEESPESGTTPSAGETEGAKQEERPVFPAPDFTLVDQFGEEHTLSDYKGKVVFLNFWTTWCGYCKQEMPHIEELYAEYGNNGEDVVILGVAAPSSSEFPQNADNATKEEIASYLETEGLTFPTIMDTTGDIFAAYGINSFPTTFMIDRDGNIYGYVPGAMTKEIMADIISQTLEADTDL